MEMRRQRRPQASPNAAHSVARAHSKGDRKAFLRMGRAYSTAGLRCQRLDRTSQGLRTARQGPGPRSSSAVCDVTRGRGTLRGDERTGRELRRTVGWRVRGAFAVCTECACRRLRRWRALLWLDGSVVETVDRPERGLARWRAALRFCARVIEASRQRSRVLAHRGSLCSPACIDEAAHQHARRELRFAARRVAGCGRRPGPSAELGRRLAGSPAEWRRRWRWRRQ